MSKTSVKRVVNATLADKSWDNTGLLLDSSVEDAAQQNSPIKVLLTIDLTQSVADEAINKGAKFIMAYHPFIFRGLKSITPQDPQQRSLLRLVKNDISVYSPHTAVDSAKGGVNDFLVDAIAGKSNVQNSAPIEPDSSNPECGMGRLVNLKQPINLKALVPRVKEQLGLDHVHVAESKNGPDHEIRSIAICAGSGGGVFKGLQADLYFTGELSHHEALFFKESGSSVICCNHSNTERPFLRYIKEQLESELQSSDEVIISATDRDPFQTW
ncbi:NIF3 [Candida theae]|uniref:NIF3 n=1 Tax=Candida theae TaxID=1198502 RepID=A0AAD5BF61_9ASCO|nr:NIF3 [Candida theae]KAI5958665.1 NIF3 [Candida theae]